MRVDVQDKRYRKLVDWLANEHSVLVAALRREPTAAEHRAHAHAFIDMVFDDEEQAGAAWAARRAAEATNVVPLRPQ
jgi:hypothetical protein